MPCLLRTLAVPPVIDDDRVVLEACTLTLRRAWPRGLGHLLLEYVAPGGTVIGGQWMEDRDRIERIAAETAAACPGASPDVLAAGDGYVLLHAVGADRVLRPLRGLLRDGGDLVAHRAERRATVRIESPAGARYAKLAQPKKVGRIVTAVREVEGLGGCGFSLPRLLEWDEARGVTIWAPLPGVRLDHLLDSPQRLVKGSSLVGEALRHLHGARVEAPRHGAEEEVAVLDRWLSHLDCFDPEFAAMLRPIAAGICRRLRTGEGALSAIHRDLYDKQIMVAEGGSIGILDFDTLAMGEPALDMANMLVHLELRALQGSCAPELAGAAARALLHACGAGRDVRRRIDVYADAARLRLCCVYAFRPQWPQLPELLVRKVGRRVRAAAFEAPAAVSCPST